MDIYEIAGYPSGIDGEGVNFLDPIYAFQSMENGYVYRQELKSRQGFFQFGNRLGNQVGDTVDNTRVMGIFEFIKPDDTKDLLVITKQFLYKYSDTSGIFSQIPNNSANPFVSFNISGNDEYVSGTSYPTASNGQRFVFTGSGMSDIYFYDGTDVKRFTNTTDNTKYVPPTAGAIRNAKYIAWFGERLNLFSPTVATVKQTQQVLYTGIRTAGGNGDKFNVVGSGSLSASTDQYMTGATIAGDYMLLNFNRSSWTIEKTRDVYNPYFIRKIPSVLGTDADFSSVTWNNETQSVGKTGVVKSDGRNSLRTDTKIPHFTADKISQIDFNLTYGGFDRVNSQFLFAYRQGGSDLTDVTQDKVLVHNYEEGTWSVNDQRFSVFGQTDLGLDLAWNNINETNNPSWARWDTTEEIWSKIGLGKSEQKTLAGDNYSFVYQINKDYDDYYIDITGITVAAAAVITVSPCALQIGDRLKVENVVGMTQINGTIGTVTAIGTTLGATTSVTVDIISTNFTAYSSGGSVSKTIEFYAELVPFNPYREQGLRVRVSHVEFLLNAKDGGSLLVDVFEDEEESPFKSNVLLQPSSTSTKAREWITMIVNQEANFMTFAFKQESASNQVVISSIRLHCEPGGMTSA